jgi:hypothetical protein
MPLGTYILKVMTFGLCNVLSVFKQVINRDLCMLKQKYLDYFANFKDNMSMATDDSEAECALHCKIIHKFLECLEKHLYFLKVLKCQFKQEEIDFLGYTVKKWHSVDRPYQDFQTQRLAANAQISERSVTSAGCFGVPMTFHLGLC